MQYCTCWNCQFTINKHNSQIQRSYQSIPSRADSCRRSNKFFPWLNRSKYFSQKKKLTQNLPRRKYFLCERVKYILWRLCMVTTQYQLSIWKISIIGGSERECWFCLIILNNNIVTLDSSLADVSKFSGWSDPLLHCY